VKYEIFINKKRECVIILERTELKSIKYKLMILFKFNSEIKNMIKIFFFKQMHIILFEKNKREKQPNN
jgi:hypothetical protein